MSLTIVISRHQLKWEYDSIPTLNQFVASIVNSCRSKMSAVLLASVSDYHTFHKFKPGGCRQAAQTYLDAVRVTVDAGIRPRLYLEDATRAPMEFMQRFIEAVQEICALAGGLRPTFRVCDTMGL